jgi:hypothetical protein
MMFKRERPVGRRKNAIANKRNGKHERAFEVLVMRGCNGPSFEDEYSKILPKPLRGNHLDALLKRQTEETVPESQPE